MNRRIFLSQFSPQRTRPEDLEAILVQRHDLLDNVVGLMRESALTGNKHHVLFVGPRGAGKTHLVTLIHHRLSQDPAIADRLRFAWLNEDEMSTSFLKLLVRIYRDLSARYPADFSASALEGVIGKDPDDARRALGNELVRQLGSRTVLVLIENLDALFARLPEIEQRTWRAFIQDHPVFATVASAQRLFDGVAQRDHPFFGFFDTRHLAPLDVEHARELLQNIARLKGDDALLDFLASPRAIARLRAIHYLAGGNPRLYVVLSDLITRETLDDVVRAFEEMVDRQLTSYYQERLRWLAPQQQEIVQFLCVRRHPVPVKEIAENLFAAHSTITSQLKQLREMGYVLSHARGRESWYEVAEPLMRLVMEVKEARDRRPLALIVDFLRVWYDRSELESHLARHPAEAEGRDYLRAAIEKLGPGEPDLRLSLLRHGIDDLDLAHCGADDIDRLRSLAGETNAAADWNRYALACAHRGDLETARVGWTQAIDLPGAPVDPVARALVNRGVALGMLGRSEEEIADYTRVIELPGAPVDPVATALFNRGVALGMLGRSEEKIADYTRVIDLPGAPVDPVASALFHRGFELGKLGRSEEAIADYTRVIDLPGAPVERVARALNNRGFELGKLGRSEEAIADYTRVIDLPGAPVKQVAAALFNRGFELGKLGRSEEAIADYTRVIDLPGAPVDPVARALVNRGIELGKLGRSEEAIADYTRVIDLPGAPVEQVAAALNNRGTELGKLGRSEEEIADYTRVIDLPGAPVDPVATALFNRGFELGKLGRSEEEIADYTRVIDLPGAPVNPVARALVNRGIELGKLGRSEEEIADYTRVIDLPGAPVEQIARALNYRGIRRAEGRKPNEALLDVSRLFDSIDRSVSEPMIGKFSSPLAKVVVESLFSQSSPSGAWRQGAGEFVSRFAGFRILGELGQALVRHLPNLAESHLNSAGLDAWAEGWAGAAAGHPEMEVPLRLLRGGIEYLKTRDEGSLLRLPQEERRLVRQALNLPDETTST